MIDLSCCKQWCYLLLLLPMMSFALPEDAQKTMHIVASSSMFNYKTGINTYEGNVKIDQGTTHVIADQVITTNNKQHKIESAVAYGSATKLAEYITLPKPGDQILYAKAKIIKFYPLQSLIVLEENVVVTQGKNSFQGPIILYNMKDQIVTAPSSKTGRATIVIEPDKLK